MSEREVSEAEMRRYLIDLKSHNNKVQDLRKQVANAVATNNQVAIREIHNLIMLMLISEPLHPTWKVSASVAKNPLVPIDLLLNIGGT